MKNGKLATLEKLELREIWQSESQDFTPWLAQPENLILLGETLDLELELQAIERNVGPFRADILCKEVNSDHLVLIENQLGLTDHLHLGQILTYAAGLEAFTIVWVAKKFTEEHRATLDWLNEITDKEINFFGLEIELWRIGASAPAPKFNVVAEPNNWRARVSEGAHRIELSELSETKKIQHEYWTIFAEFLRQNSSIVRPQKPSPQHWMSFSLGRSGIHLSATVNSQKQILGVEVYMGDEAAKNFFSQLLEQRNDIERELGIKLDWMELPEKKATRIITRLENADFQKKADWPRQHNWLKTQLEAFRRVFGQRAKTLSRDQEEDAA